MSDFRKMQMVQQAARKMGGDYEREARRWLAGFDCSLAGILVSSGGPSTENVVTCSFNLPTHREGGLGLAGRQPECDASPFGRVNGCGLRKWLYNKRMLAVQHRHLALLKLAQECLLALKEIQESDPAAWEMVVNGHMGYRRLVQEES